MAELFMFKFHTAEAMFKRIKLHKYIIPDSEHAFVCRYK